MHTLLTILITTDTWDHTCCRPQFFRLHRNQARVNVTIANNAGTFFCSPFVLVWKKLCRKRFVFPFLQTFVKKRCRRLFIFLTFCKKVPMSPGLSLGLPVSARVCPRVRLGHSLGLPLGLSRCICVQTFIYVGHILRPILGPNVQKETRI